LLAQEGTYDNILSNIKNGNNKNHCMWYIFPQLEGLGFSPAAKHYGIQGLSEAREYLQHEVLGARLIECSQALLSLDTTNVADIFSFPDSDKLKACMTLFSIADESNLIFQAVLSKFFDSIIDKNTMQLLNTESV